MTENILYNDGDPILISNERGMMRRREDLEKRILSDEGLELWTNRSFIVKTVKGRIQIWDYFVTWDVSGDSAYED